VGCTSAEEGLELLKRRPFDVVVSDEQMPNMLGSEFLAQVHQAYPYVPRIMLSGRADLSALTRAVNDAEIFRFLKKPIRAKELYKVICEAAELGRMALAQEEVWNAARQQHATLSRLNGDAVPSDERNHTARSRFVGFRPEVSKPHRSFGAEHVSSGAEHLARLSEREREIVGALVAGQRVKEIAGTLTISAHTVRNHLKAIYRKLNVGSQLELVRKVGGLPASDAL
jgi:DNA-binding NarL/FixJ family response regulator